MFKRASYLKKSSGSNTTNPSGSTAVKSNGDGSSSVTASSKPIPAGPSSPPSSGGFLSRVRQAGSRSGIGGGGASATAPATTAAAANQKTSASSQPARQSSANPVEANGKSAPSPIMPSLFRMNTLPGVTSARPSFDNSSISSFSSVSMSSSLERDRNENQNGTHHGDVHDIWDHDHAERDIRVPLFGNTRSSSVASSLKDRPKAAAAAAAVTSEGIANGRAQSDRLISTEPPESVPVPSSIDSSSASPSVPVPNGIPNGSHAQSNGNHSSENTQDIDSENMLGRPLETATSSLPQPPAEPSVPIPPAASDPAPAVLVDIQSETESLSRKNNPFETPSVTPSATEIEAPATAAAAASGPAPLNVTLLASPAAPASSNGDSVHSISKHHHHHVHRSEGHTHSPPAPDFPPIRAATLSGLADVSALANNNGPGKKRFMNGKSGGGFMSGLSRKFKDPKTEGALALASLPPSVPAPELSPQAKVDRAKQAERAHLLQICMELGVEIYDIAPDGNCLYGAIADQLYQLKKIKDDENNPRTTRAAAADYMLAHPDSFMPFLVGVIDPDETDDDKGATDDGMMTVKGFEKYCARVRSSTEWGGEPEILALSRYYQIPIHVIQSNHPKIVAHSPDPKAKATLDSKAARKIKAVRISYHRRLYGLGEHYNSLRKITYQISSFSAMVPM